MTTFRAALIYDFDGTLARGNLQERSFIPAIGMNETTFWGEVHKIKEQNDADEILTYMQYMLKKAKDCHIDIKKSDLEKHGYDADLFPGLEGGEWFKRINAHAHGCGIELQHYIVSSGIKEMIEGCHIAKNFTHIFASKFHYENDIAIWPAVAINYTTKTQYLFRINKGVMNNWDNKSINAFTHERKRPIPFEHMIFIGDGDTDIPTMKMLTYKGGQSIAVYDPKPQAKDLGKVHQLISDGRVEFVAPADYCENSQLEIFIKGILGRMQRQLEE